MRAEGEFRDVGMSEGQQGSWSGSGFIIDPSGIAATSAHVAEGAATLKVYVGGAEDSVNAQILGISECHDLAVIDLEGDGFSYLAWHQGPVDVTTPVWAAGFPLGDPQYTVTDGSIAKNNADGQREWASLDCVYESTAPIQHGNSGGPQLAEDGTFYDPDASIAGIWVSGVRSGSPASEAGITGGDIITQMEGRDAVTEADFDTSGGRPRVTKARSTTSIVRWSLCRR